MKIGLRLFLSSATFGIAIALAYWLVSREITGTFLLGFMACALSFVAGYMIFAEKDADLRSDRKDANPGDGAGTVIGVYTTRSPLPFWIAIAVVAAGLGLVISPSFAVVALIAILALGAAFIAQSR